MSLPLTGYYRFLLSCPGQDRRNDKGHYLFFLNTIKFFTIHQTTFFSFISFFIFAVSFWSKPKFLVLNFLIQYSLGCSLIWPILLGPWPGVAAVKIIRDDALVKVLIKVGAHLAEMLGYFETKAEVKLFF